jgi:hypothetical protein
MEVLEVLEVLEVAGGVGGVGGAGPWNCEKSVRWVLSHSPVTALYVVPVVSQRFVVSL